jgi:hypothetical protein
MNTAVTKHFLLFFLLSNAAFGQNIRDNWQSMPANPENFARVMRMTSPTEAQFDTIWNVTQQYHGKSPDSCRLLAEHAVELTKNHPITRLHGEALYLLGKTLTENGQPDAGLKHVLSAREILKTEKKFDTPGVVETFLGRYYARNSQSSICSTH